MSQVDRKKSGRSLFPDGEKIRRLRQEKGFSQQSFSEETGLSPETISNVERSKNVYVRTLRKIALHLKVKVEDILIEKGADVSSHANRGAGISTPAAEEKKALSQEYHITTTELRREHYDILSDAVQLECKKFLEGFEGLDTRAPDRYQELSTLSAVVVGRKLKVSPINVDGFLGIAKKQLFIVGMDLWWIAKNRKNAIFGWLREGASSVTKREVRFLICNPKDKRNKRKDNPFLEGWAAMGSTTKDDLKKSVKEFRRWISEASEEELDFQVRLAPALTAGLTIIDWDTPWARMTLTPILPVDIIAAERPHFLIDHRCNEDIFDYYWLRHRDMFDRATPLR